MTSVLSRSTDQPRDPAAAREAALAVWRAQLAAEVDASATREDRLDADRREAARQRERDAVAARLDALGPPPSLERPRAVLVHRNAWLRAKVATLVADHGIEVVADVEDGADGIAAVVVEQPDLLLVEDLLPTVSGADLVRRARELAPDVQLAVHAADEPSAQRLVAAGAHAAWTRRVGPADLAEGLARLVAVP